MHAISSHVSHISWVMAPAGATASVRRQAGRAATARAMGRKEPEGGSNALLQAARAAERERESSGMHDSHREVGAVLGPDAYF